MKEHPILQVLSEEHKIARHVAMLYALVGVLWILVSDQFVLILVNDTTWITRLQTLKGCFFVGLTAVGLYLFLGHYAKQVRRRRTLHQTEGQTQVLLDTIPDLIFHLRRDGTFLDCRGAPADMVMPPEQALGKRIQELLPQIAPQTMYAIEQSIHTGEVQTFHYQLSIRGEPRDFEVRLAASGSDEVIAIVRDITDRTQAENALAEERNLLRTLIDNLPHLIYAKDTQSRFTLVNPTILRLMGASTAEELMGKTDFDFYPRELAERYYADEQDIMRSGQLLIDREEPTNQPDGTQRWLQTTKVPLRNSQGEIVGLVGIGRDITERIQVQKALAEERNLLRTLIDNLPDRVYVKDRDGRHLLTNTADARSKGASGPEDTIGQTDFDFYPPELAAQFHADDQAIIESGQPLVNHEEPGLFINSERCWILTTKVPLHNSQGEIVGLVGIGRDITERKQAEEALRASEERYRTLFDGVPVGLYRSTPDGTLLDANPALVNMLGFPDRDRLLATKTPSVYVNPPDRVRWQAALERSGVVRDFEVQVRRYDGTILWGRDTAHIVRDDDGQVLYYEGSLEDMTTYKQAEQVLRQAHDELEHRVEERTAELAAERNLLRTLIDILPDHIYIKDAQSRFITINTRMVRALDVSTPEEAIGKTDLDFHPPELAERFYADEQRIVQTGEPLINHEEPGIDPDGTERWVLTTKVPLRDKDGQIVRIVGIGRDITERKTMEDALRRSHDELERRVEERTAELSAANATLKKEITERKQAEEELAKAQALLTAAIEQSPAGILIADSSNQKVRITNSAAVGIFGQPLETVDVLLDTLKTWTDMASYPDGRPYAFEDTTLIRALQQGETTTNVELRLRRADGEERWILSNGAPVRDVTGTIIAGITVFLDITEKKHAEEALRRANRAYRALSDCNQAMVRATDETGLLDEICQIIVGVGEYRMAWVGLIRPDEPFTLYPMAQAGQDSERLVPIDISSPHSPSSTVIRTGVPYVIDDTQTHPGLGHWREQMEQHDLLSAILLPLNIDNETTGVLQVYSDTLRPFDVEEVGLLTELAGDLAYGIETLRTRAERQRAENQLRQSEANLRALFENIQESIWSVDTEYRLVTLNPAFKLQFQWLYDVELEPGMRTLDHLPPARQAEHRACYDRALGGERFILEAHFERAGESFYSDISYNPIVDDNGTITGVSVFSHNVTQRKQAEAARQQLNAQLEQRNRDLLVLHEVGHTLAATLNIQEIYQMMYRVVGQLLLDAPYFHIALFDDTTQTFQIDFAIINQEQVAPSMLPTVQLGEDPINHTIRTRQPQIVDLDAHRDLPYDPADAEHWKTGVFIPLISSDKVIGVMSVQHNEVDAFKDADLTILSISASQAAIAIRNAQLFAAEREQYILTEALRDIAVTLNSTLDFDTILEHILTGLKRVVPHESASITLIEDGVVRVVRSRGYAERGLADWIETLRFTLDNNAILRQIAQDKQPIIIPDTYTFPGWERFPETDWVRSVVAAPIVLDGQLIGVFSLDSSQTDFFTPEHVERVQVFTEQAAVAIRNARLFAAVQQHAADLQAQTQRLTLINRVSTQLAQTFDPQEIYRIVLHELQTVVGAEYGGLTLFEGESTARLMLDTHPEDPLHSDVTFTRQGDRAIEYIYETRRPLVSEDVLNDPLFERSHGLLRRRAAKSLMFIPLVAGDEVIGTIGLDSTTPRTYSAAEIEFAETIASQASVAIVKAQLYILERDQRILAEALSDTAAAINSTLDVDEVLDRILNNIGRALPHDAANLMLIDDDGMARLVRHHGYERFGTLAWVNEVTYRIDQTPTLQRPFESGQPFAITDTTHDPDWSDFPETRWVRSVASAPIRLDDQVIGFLFLDSATPGTFTQSHADQLQAFADQAAIAIRNARLFSGEREQRTLAEALRDTATALNQTLDPEVVMDCILNNVGRVVPHDAANIMLIEDGVARIVRGHGYAERGLGEWIENLRFVVADVPLWQPMIETGQPLVVPDTTQNVDWQTVGLEEEKWILSTLKVPIVLDERLIGILHLDSATRDAFTPKHAEQLQAFADQAATAIRNAQLFTAEHNQRILAEALTDTAAAVNSTLDFNEVLERILSNLGRISPHESANIMLIEEGVATVVRSYAASADSELHQQTTGIRLVVSQTTNLHFMVETGQPLAIPDTQAYPGWVDIPEARWIRSMAAAPIRQHNETTGFLTLNSATPNFYNQKHAERLQAFADQAATAIRNAQLFMAERNQRILAEALTDTAAAVNSTLNFDEVLERLLDNVERVVTHDAANIMLIDDNRMVRIVCEHGYANYGVQDWFKSFHISLDEWPDGELVFGGQNLLPFAMTDTHTDPKWVRYPENEWIRSSIKVPIPLEGHLIGILNLDNTEPESLTQQHANQLQAFADQAAIAIRNAQLYDAVQRHAAELEQRVAERTAEVEAQRAQLQAILDSMGEALLYTTTEQVVYINRAFLDLFGYDEAELMTDPAAVRDHFSIPLERQDVHGKIMKSLNRGQSWHGEAWLERQDGTRFDVAITCSPVTQSGEQAPLSIVTVIRDISQEKALQDQKDRFIANASHELRTPLANFKTRLYLIRRQPEKLDTHLDVLERVTTTMTDLVKNLLDVSRFERGIIPLSCRMTVLQDVITDVVAIQTPEAERKRIAVHTKLPPQPVPAQIDPQRIAQVLTNLITNAINYTPNEGAITIELDTVQHEDTPQAVICVRDTGIGIAPELLNQVFDPFFRAHEEITSGTGLGLTIAREIVRMHQGTITVESEVDKGSVFTVTLDLPDKTD